MKIGYIEKAKNKAVGKYIMLIVSQQIELRQIQRKSNKKQLLMSRLDNSVHSLNSSSSKQRYTFSKSPRFQSSRKPLTDSFYDLPPTKITRSTTFGFGKKDLGIRYEKVSPSPQAYDIGSSFLKGRKGFSFGQGRQDMQITGPLNECINKRYIPSPNLYYPKKEIDAFNITLKSKLQDRSNDHLKNLPGPGTYNWQQMGSSNYYITSKYSNQMNYKIPQTSRPETTGNEKYNNPKLGPGSYDLKSTQLNKLGEYFNSKIRNSQVRKFAKQERPDQVIKHLLTTPGPTKYPKFSDFGNS